MRMNFAIIRNRWITLIAATFGMMLIGLYQYSWTLFSIPLQKELGTTTATIQLTFTIFTWVSTWTQPLVGTFIDRKGPLLLNILGGILTGIGWVASSLVKTPLSLYLAYSLGSIGVGIVYAISVGTATRWFPDRRGLATGLVIFGFGFGAAFLNPIISWIVTTSGFRSAFLYMGVIMLLALLILSFFSRFPPLEWRPKQEPFNTASTIHEESDHEFTTKEMVKTHQWWLLYSALILTSNTGLMVTSQLTYLGNFFNISVETVVLTSAIFPFANGVGRIVGGFISDRIGRERAMNLYFILQGILSILLLFLGSTGAAFVTIVASIGFLWGPIFTFFPAIISDYYGRKNSTVNYGLTYTAKGWGGLLGGYVASLLSLIYGGFTTPIVASAAFNFIATILVLPIVLRRPLARVKAGTSEK